MRAGKLFCLVFLILDLCFSSIAFAETIVLKSGQKIEGKIIEKTKDSIKINFEGVELTYFMDEIKSIDGNIVSETAIDKTVEAEKLVNKNALTVSSDVNAASIYSEAVANLNNIPEDFPTKVRDLIRNGWSDDYAYLKDILTKNQTAIAKFKEATKLQYCDFTFGKVIEKTAASPLPIPSKIFDPVRLIMIQARLHENENKYDLALNNYISVLRFEYHLNQQKDFMLLSNIIAIIAQNMVYDPLTQYINRKDFSLQECTNLLDTLLFLRKNKIGLDKAFEEEKESLKNTIRMLGEEAKRQGKYIDSFYQTMYKEFDERQEEFNKYLVIAYKENKPNIYDEKVTQFENEVKKETEPLNVAWETLKRSLGIPSGISSPSLVAKILSVIGTPQFSKIITKYYIALSKFNVLLTAVAVKSYEIKNGKVPDSLQVLKPEYLPELPEDPFNDFNPLKFEKRDKGWVIYSLGPDRQDNHATIMHSGKEEDIKAAGDVVFLSTN